MKIIHLALTALLLNALLFGPALESAQAGVHVSGMGRAGSSSAFRGGFSSQKSMVQRAAPAGNAKNTAFGSFGTAGNSATPSPAGNSALSRDLNASSANANALKTFDARNQAQSPMPGAAPAGVGMAPAVPSTIVVPQPVYVQHGGFSWNPFMWFMIGHSMASDRDRVVVVNGGNNGNTAGADPAQNASGANPVAAMPATDPAPQQSFVSTLLHALLKTLLWGAVTVGGIGAALVYFARRAARRANHYSL